MEQNINSIHISQLKQETSKELCSGGRLMWLAYPNEGYQVHSVAKDPKHWSKAVRTTWGALQKLPRNIPELLG